MKLKHSVFNVLLSFLFCSLSIASEKSDEKKEYFIEQIVVAEVNSTINPSVSNYLEKILNKKNHEKKLLLIKLNTPGGLVTTTKDILNLFGRADIPIVLWITPEGASATSAGALIAAGAHVIYMSAGTNIGAATPITVSGDLPKGPQETKKENEEEQEEGQEETSPAGSMGSDMRAKAINDLVALVSSLAQARGRPHQPFELMVTEAKSYTVSEAIDEKIINGQVNRLAQMSQKLNGEVIRLKGDSLKLVVSDDVEFVVEEMSLSDQIINLFAHPQTAYLLFLLGAALLYFELQAPGGMIAGSIGVLCLLLAALGFQVLPINFAGIGLIVLALLFFIFDLYVTSYGIFSLLGLASLFFGSSLIYQTDDSLIRLSSQFIYSIVLAVGLSLAFLSWYFIKTFGSEKDSTPAEAGQGIILKLIEKNKDQYIYHVRFEGTLWTASYDREIAPQTRVMVEKNKDQLKLKINQVI